MDETLIAPASAGRRGAARAAGATLRVLRAVTRAMVEDAQRLRFKVFAGELGADIDAREGLDIDPFDAFCDHFVVLDERSGRVVGTYRVLAPAGARAAGRLYSDGAFDLHRLDYLRGTMVEAGRACVHRDFRDGAAMLLLWAGLARYMRQHGYTHMIGCASVGLADGGRLAASVFDATRASLAEPEHRVLPYTRFPHERFERLPEAGRVRMPALIKGYLRVGARICGEPAWDPQFNTADFPVLLALAQLDARYARHFDLDTRA